MLGSRWSRRSETLVPMPIGRSAGATATFATAGGSFTTAASAQVNEAKLLTKISQQSRDFLAMIMQNTARMAGGLNLA
jgi:hypothetical protein